MTTKVKPPGIMGNVQVGDRIIVDGRTILHVCRVTVHSVFAHTHGNKAERRFRRDGFEVGGFGSRACLATEDDVRRIADELAATEKERQRREQERIRRESQPGYAEAAFLADLSDMGTDDILKKYGAARCVAAAQILRNSPRALALSI